MSKTSCCLSGARVRSGTVSPRFRSFTIALSYTPNSVGLLWTSDQTKTEATAFTTHNMQKRQRSIPPAGIEPIVPVSKEPPTYALNQETAGFREQNTRTISKCLTRTQRIKEDMFENIYDMIFWIEVFTAIYSGYRVFSRGKKAGKLCRPSISP
jgi:hypothetical protein